MLLIQTYSDCREYWPFSLKVSGCYSDLCAILTHMNALPSSSYRPILFLDFEPLERRIMRVFPLQTPIMSDVLLLRLLFNRSVSSGNITRRENAKAPFSYSELQVHKWVDTRGGGALKVARLPQVMPSTLL